MGLPTFSRRARSRRKATARAGTGLTLFCQSRHRVAPPLGLGTRARKASGYFGPRPDIRKAMELPVRRAVGEPAISLSAILAEFAYRRVLSWVAPHSQSALETMENVPPILVVDDEPLVRLTFVDALEDSGYTVLEADSGSAAMELIDQQGTLRGLVTDIRMSGEISGWEVGYYARKKFPSLAVIYVTGDSAGEWPANGVPFSLVLQKPFASVELVTAMATLLVTQQTPPSP